MTLHLPAVVAELARLGVRAAPFRADGEGRAGVVAVGRGQRIGDVCTYLTGQDLFLDPEAALEWAAVVATLSRGLRA